MKKTTLYLIGVCGTVSDYITTRIGLKYPEIEEMNPLVNPLLEGASVLVGQAAILKLGEKLKVNPELTIGLALVPAMVPFAAAVNNLIRISIVHAKYYPWEECPLLYSEESITT